MKLADNYKGKVTQVQAPAAMVPVPLAMAPGYLQTQKPPGSETPVGYTYPQSMAAYPNATYSNSPAAPSPYPLQPQMPYPQYAAKRDPPPPTLPSLGGYPYYMPKQ